MSIRTRFAPSPTGYLHVGGARTALFCWLEAKARDGVFILRIEDTDLERSTEESVQAILDGMEWLGLDYDEGPIYQTHRFDRYAEVIEQLLEEGKAYHCYCSKERLETLREEQMAAGQCPGFLRITDRDGRELMRLGDRGGTGFRTVRRVLPGRFAFRETPRMRKRNSFPRLKRTTSTHSVHPE